MKIICPHCKQIASLTPKLLFSETCPNCHERMDLNNGKAYSNTKFVARAACIILFFILTFHQEPIQHALSISEGVFWVIAIILFGIFLGLAEVFLLKSASRQNQSGI